MDGFVAFLEKSLSPYHAVQNAAELLAEHGFVPLAEGEPWDLKKGGSYYTVRGGSLIAFRLGGGDFKIIASHTDSPCFKLKETPAICGEFTRLNTEPYGSGIWYTFFDRPLKIAGRVIKEENGVLRSHLYTGESTLSIPSLAVHQNREVNEKFSPDLQTDLPLYALGAQTFSPDAVSYDLFLSCAEKPFFYGADNEFLSSPRLDNLTGVYSSLEALQKSGAKGTCVAACLESEEIGSRTYAGAGSDFLKNVLFRISAACNRTETEHLCSLARSISISLDNAHSLHPNHPEKCDPTNRAVMGGGVAIKVHAGGAYTTDALTSAAIKTVFGRAGVKYQTFFNRSDMRSGSTLGAISLGQAGVPSVDLGLAQLAMHSAVETIAKDDFTELVRGLTAFYESEIRVECDNVLVK